MCTENWKRGTSSAGTDSTECEAGISHPINSILGLGRSRHGFQARLGTGREALNGVRRAHPAQESREQSVAGRGGADETPGAVHEVEVLRAARGSGSGSGSHFLLYQARPLGGPLSREVSRSWVQEKAHWPGPCLRSHCLQLSDLGADTGLDPRVQRSLPQGVRDLVRKMGQKVSDYGLFLPRSPKLGCSPPRRLVTSPQREQ